MIRSAGSSNADCGIHYVDLFSWIVGCRITDVFARGLRTEGREGDGPNACILTRRAEDGSIGWVEDCWTRTAEPKGDLECIGPLATVACHWEDNVVRLKIRHVTNDRTTSVDYAEPYKPLGAEMEELINDIEHDRSTLDHLDNVLHATEVILAANNHFSPS